VVSAVLDVLLSQRELDWEPSPHRARGIAVTPVPTRHSRGERRAGRPEVPQHLQQLAREHRGLDYAQAFDTSANPGGSPLWFIEDGEAVTALLSSDY
jgi:hypothetical protein